MYHNKAQSDYNQLKALTDSKGELSGTCNRTDCHNVPATWFNHSTRKYYCQPCAWLINEANHHDAQRQFGHELCTRGEHKPNS